MSWSKVQTFLHLKPSSLSIIKTLLNIIFQFWCNVINNKNKTKTPNLCWKSSEHRQYFYRYNVVKFGWNDHGNNTSRVITNFLLNSFSINNFKRNIEHISMVLQGSLQLRWTVGQFNDTKIPKNDSCLNLSFSLCIFHLFLLNSHSASLSPSLFCSITFSCTLFLVSRSLPLSLTHTHTHTLSRSLLFSLSDLFFSKTVFTHQHRSGPDEGSWMKETSFS